MASPVVQSQRPTDGATLVAPYQPVYLEITDADGDLVAASVIIRHNGRVAWSGDAAQFGFSVTKMVIANGFSYSILPIVLPARGSVVQIEVYAEDAIPNSVSETHNYQIGVTEYLIRFDDFDDASLDVDIVDPAGNGIVTEPAGTALKLDCPNSLQCHWWAGVANAPRPYYPFDSWMLAHPGVFQVESKLSQYDESANGLSYGGGPFIHVDDQNMVEVGYLLHTSYRDIRVHRGVANSFALRYETGPLSPPNTTPHRYKIVWNNGRKAFTLSDGTMLNVGDITFFYSIDDGVTWVRAYTEVLAFDPTNLLGFGVMLRKDPTGAGDNAQAYIDYLELRELLPPDELEVEASWDGVNVEDAAQPISAGGPGNYGDGISKGLLMPGPPEQQPGSMGPFDDAQPEDTVAVLDVGGPAYGTPEGVGVHLPGQQVGPAEFVVVQDEISWILGGLTDYRQTTNDFNGHPHFISERITKASIYDAAGEAGLWTTPTDPSFTGYGKDGKYYVAGVDQASFAPWYDEAESDDRGPTKPFPDKVLVCVGQDGSSKTNKEIVIFDLDSFPTTLNVWMRFKFNTGNNAYFAMGNESKQVTSIAMANGVLVMGSIPGSDRAYLHLMDFKGVGQDCAYMLNASDDWLAASGKTLADRNTQPFWTTTGGLGYRMDEEYIYSVAAHLDVDGQLWVACAGEDPGPNLYRINTLNPRPNRHIQVTGDVGDTDIGDKRKTTFDEDGNWWFSIEKRLHRIVPIDYQDGYAYLDLSVQNRRRGGADEWVELPYEVLNFAAVGDYLFVGTEVGVYRVHRGSMAYALAYTIVGGGGGGTADTPPDGELIPGDDPEILWLTGHALHSAHYLHLSTRRGVATIRTLDDVAVDSRLFPDLDEPGAHFNVATVD